MDIFHTARGRQRAMARHARSSDMVGESKAQKRGRASCVLKTTSRLASSGRNTVAKTRLNRKLLKFRYYLIASGKEEKILFLLSSQLGHT